MKTTPISESDGEVTFMSGLKYCWNMWLLGCKMIVKAFVGWIMICLMLGLPAFLFQVIPFHSLPNDQARQAVTILCFAIYFGFITPIAFYVGASTVGFCPRLSSATYAAAKKRS